MIAVPEEIKELYHQDHCYKNIRIHFPNGERADICNDLIVKDSVSFKESLCSQNTLKFGLCEASVFECETVGVGNINGAKIEVSCEIECPSSVTGAEWRVDLQKNIYPVKYGFFTVTEAKRQADMIHRKITAYGGTNILSEDNAILKAKESAVATSAIDYQPNVLATMLMCTEGNGELVDAPLSEIGQDATLTIFGSPQSMQSRGLYKCKVIYINSSNQDKLYYIPDPGYIREYNSTIPDSGVLKYRPQTAAHSYMRYIIKNNGAYIYPYQLLNKSEGSGTDVAYVALFIAYQAGQMSGGTETWFDPFRDKDECKIYEVDLSNYPEYRLNIPRIEGVSYEKYHGMPYSESGYLFDASSIDYYKAFQDYTELLGEFFTLDRTGAPRIVNIKQQFGLLPNTNLYPDPDLYPEGVTGGKLLPNDYQSCWYDDKYSRLYGKITVKYKDTNNVDQVYDHYINGFGMNDDPKSYQTYDLSQNSIFSYWLWSAADIADVCSVIANNLEGVRYMPVDFVGRGLPYVEAGDTFEILTKSNDSITTIVLNRTITGEQTLTDSYKSV